MSRLALGAQSTLMLACRHADGLLAAVLPTPVTNASQLNHESAPFQGCDPPQHLRSAQVSGETSNAADSPYVRHPSSATTACKIQNAAV